jgi:hypothetical protein
LLSFLLSTFLWSFSGIPGALEHFFCIMVFINVFVLPYAYKNTNRHVLAINLWVIMTLICLKCCLSGTSCLTLAPNLTM